MKDFEKECMQARLDLAERQLKEAIERAEQRGAKTAAIEMSLVLSTVTGKPNFWIEF
ncbi:hypothetical protein [Bacillus wiedmannii]|uniref:hypothetical protein n=1 Tax=Bacillus wiedmannii TaxID=1890302 RepID=UPI0015D4F221|nr:hypothetical protein [Bacillus wiedmannii]